MKRNSMAVRGLGLAGVVALAAVVACVPRVRAPEVDLVGVRLGGLGLEGGVVHVALSISNPNAFALVADGLSYDVDLSDPREDDGWVDLAEGVFEEDFRVEAEDTAEVEIPVEFTYGGVGGLVRSVLRTGTFEYRVRGQVQVEEPVGTRIPYDRTGTITVTGESGD
ncbi:MAG: LEA type 2 family protein [Gemmatimonadota bacterium]